MNSSNSLVHADIAICGAGIAGVACAVKLARGARELNQTLKIILIERGDPLSLTSDKSTECYRNWWPGPGDAVVQFINRSIDLLEHEAVTSGNRFFGS